MIELFDANNVFLRDFENIDPTKTQARFTYECATPNYIYVWDGMNPNKRRRDIFPGYKIRDKTGREDVYAGLALMREILSHSRAHQVECPGWEADDVIGTLAVKFASEGVQVKIHTNDLDYYQLKSQFPNIILDGVRRPDYDARWVCLFKTLCGDTSDKIPGIPGFGPKKFEALSQLFSTLEECFKQNNFEEVREIVSVTPKIKLWLSDDKNLDLLFSYWQIVHLMWVPLDEIEAGWKKGIYNQAAAEVLFRRFML